MFINHNGIICYISKISQPHKIWYHIWVDLKIYGKNYIKEKLGVTDSLVQRQLRNEFHRAVISYRLKPAETQETHNLRLDKVDYPFYIAHKTEDSVTVFIEKGLFTLYPGQPNGVDRPPKGYPWAVIMRTDTPEIIQAKLYDHRKRFGPAMRKKLKKFMAW